MKCPTCGHENVERDSSCGVCGSPLEPPEAEYSSFWVRLAAAAYDLFIFILIPLATLFVISFGAVVLLIILGHAGIIGRLGVPAADPVAVGALYLAVFITLVSPLLYVIRSSKGRSPGKIAFKIKVVGSDGRSPGIGKGLQREATGKLVPFYFLLGLLWVTRDFDLLMGALGIVLLLGFVWVIGSSKNQGWHDKIAGTYVIEAPLQDKITEAESEAVTREDDKTPKAEPAQKFDSNDAMARWTRRKMPLRSCNEHSYNAANCFEKWDLYRFYEKELGIEWEEGGELYGGLLTERFVTENHKTPAGTSLFWRIVGSLLSGTDPGAPQREYCYTTFRRTPLSLSARERQ